jgi:hypothetical protein
LKKTFAAAYGAIIALLVTVAHDNFFTKELAWPESAALVAAIGVGVLLLVAYELVGGSKVVARRFSPVAKIEGAWLITLTNNCDRPTSVSRIDFTHHDFVYHGYGINNDGTLGSSWSSRDLHYDENQNELSFTSDGIVMANGRRIRNYGYIKFSKNANGRFEYGNGYFVDMADTLSQSHMTLSRIKDSEFDDTVKGVFSKTSSIAAKTSHSAIQDAATSTPAAP